LDSMVSAPSLALKSDALNLNFPGRVEAMSKAVAGGQARRKA